MFETVLTALALWHVLAALFGFGVVWVARTRPRTAAAAVGVVVVVGLGLVRYGADAAGTDFDGGRLWYGLGLGAVAAGLPAGLLIGPAREPNGTTVGPVGVGGWARLLAGYLAACWVVVVALSGLAFLTNPPPGGFR